MSLRGSESDIAAAFYDNAHLNILFNTHLNFILFEIFDFIVSTKR